MIDQVRDLAWRVDHEGVRRMTPEGLYGRRKMTALVQRRSPDASPGSVDRAMRSLGLQGIRRCKGIRTTIPGKDGKRAGDLLDRNFTAPAPNRTWVMDFTYVRTWAGFGYVAFILDVYAQRIIAWNVASTKAVELVDVPLRMALWQRGREGHPVVRGELVGHTDAGSQYTSITFTDHLADAGVRPSIRSVADAYDNALMECVIGLYKTECIRTTIFHPGPLPHHRRRRIRDRQLGRLVQQPTPAQLSWDDDPSGVRASSLRDPQPRAATRIGAAENLGRFT